MRWFTLGGNKFSPSPWGRGPGGGVRRHPATFFAYAIALSRAGGTPPPSPFPKGEGESLP
jgi:hypothetical protein